MVEGSTKRRREKHPGEDEKKVEAVQEELETEEAVVEKVEVVESKELEQWVPKTDLGLKVKSGNITDIDEILDKGERIFEHQIVDKLVPGLEPVFINVGQSKGKFGGGKKSIWKQTQKKTAEGNKPSFGILVAIGNKNGYVGLGYGKSKETVPAREKAIKRAKLNLIKIKRGCGEWACDCKEPHSIPFEVYGKVGSVKVYLKPAPKGTGLVVESECKKLLELVGIRDIRSKTFGHTGSKLNLLVACFEALKKLGSTKVSQEQIKMAGIVEGSL